VEINMDIDFSTMTLRLTPAEFVRLDHALGARFSCIGGTAWLTIDRDRRDVILAPGDEFVVDSKRAVVVGALAPDTVLDVRHPSDAKEGTRALLDRRPPAFRGC
jgi:hypothetical protein